MPAARSCGRTSARARWTVITTAFVSVTDGWEPGLRSRARLRELVDAMAAPASRARPPRLEVHVRHECCNTEDLDELVAWIESGAVRMLSYNDHTPGGIKLVTGLSDVRVQRSGMTREALQALQDQAIERRPEGQAQERKLAAVARAAGASTASHDADDEEDLARDLELGIAFAEFPTSIALAHDYRAHDIPVLLGAPNLVRGGSHLGNLAVRDAWEAGVADMLCSDYHYPSLLQAPFSLVALGAALADAWATVSATPARVAGLSDRGAIERGRTADLVVVEPPTDDHDARVRAVVVDGRVAMLSP
ncbi:MAG: hypothetical protein DHS20C19_29560 [Acidimicrobiales bacterium]|nr:MAG: hypothetical protein DHS20C19_29560 [Acidimicrobiales bacterium]